MTGIAVRAPEPSDEAVWRRLWRGYLDFYKTALPEDVYAESWSRLLSPEIDDYHGLLATDRRPGQDGAPVGLVHYIFHRHGWRLEKVVYLQDLYVAPEARGRGAARALIEAVYAEADAAGCPQVYWLTQEHNREARRLYDRVARVTPFIKYVR